jgi:uncharacterized membrane protein
MPSYNEYVYWNNKVETYGKAIKIDRWYMRAIVFIIAALPLCTAWMFLLIPKIKDIVIRY